MSQLQLGVEAHDHRDAARDHDSIEPSRVHLSPTDLDAGTLNGVEPEEEMSLAVGGCQQPTVASRSVDRSAPGSASQSVLDIGSVVKEFTSPEELESAVGH